jgi:hypothetical protein
MQVAAMVSGATLFVDSRLCRRVVDLAADRTRATARDLSGALEPEIPSRAAAAHMQFSSSVRAFMTWRRRSIATGREMCSKTGSF